MLTASSLSANKDGRIFYLLIALSLAVVLMMRNWVGYDGADDLSYALAAENWVRHFPALGTNHWALRHTIVLPVAASLWIFGQHEISLCLPNVAFFLGFIAVNHHFGSRYLGTRAGGLLAIVLALTPEFIVQATYINIDVVEVFFVSLSFWLLTAGIVESGKAWTFAASGVAAGLAFLTRETSCVLIPLSMVGFFFCPPAKRKSYLWFWAGFAAILCAEMAYFSIAAGDPFYRYNLDAHHDSVDRSQIVQQTAAGGQVLDKEGGLSVNVMLDPLLMLFASQKYGLLFYLAIPMGFWLYRIGTFAPAERKVFGLTCWASILWIVFVSSASFILYLVPRYFVVPAWSCTIIIALALHHLWRLGKWKIGAMALAALLAVNGLSLYVENENPRFAEHALVRYLQTHPQAVVRTDPDTARRVGLLADFAGVSQRVSSASAKTGDLDFYSPANLSNCPSTRCAQYQPAPGWIKLEEFQEPPRAIGAVLRALHLASFIHPQIMRKIEQPSPGAAIYKVSPAPAAG